MFRRPPPPELPLPPGGQRSGPQSSGQSWRVVSTRRLHVSGQGTPFMSFWFSRCWWLLFLLFYLWTPGPSHLATLQVLHIWWPRRERETVSLPSIPPPPPPTSVPSDHFLFILVFVHFTVKQRFSLRIWRSDKKVHRYLTIFKSDKV